MLGKSTRWRQIGEGRQHRMLLVAPVLPVDTSELARILEHHGLLERLITRSLGLSGCAKILGCNRWTARLSRRPCAPVNRRRITACVTADLIFYLLLLFRRSPTTATDASFAWVDRRSARMVKPAMGAIIAREDSCLAAFSRAREQGVRTVYVLPTAYWETAEKLMEREIAHFPGICRGSEQTPMQLARRGRRKDKELELADDILCPSTFVKETVRQRLTENQRIKVIPFGAEERSEPDWSSKRQNIVMYAGNITVRKGIHRLLKVWKEIRAYRTHQLRLIGDMFLTEGFLAEYRGMYSHIPRLSRNRLAQHYKEASAFLFNAVADGFGYVILEAMSFGTPVICSRNSGGPDVIENGIDGVLFDQASDVQLTLAIDKALSSPADLGAMGRAAYRKSQQWRWPEYDDEFINWIKSEPSHCSSATRQPLA